MFKNLLIKCCGLMGREDLAEIIKNADTLDEIEDESSKNDCCRLISYFNYTIDNIFENYLKFLKQECITSDENSQIELSLLSSRATKIEKVTNSKGYLVRFDVYSTYIVVPKSQENYNITYRYLPNPLKNFSDEINLPLNLNEKIICYGMASEFLACKGKIEESEFFNDKFIYEIFKLKTHKEHRLRSTFKL